MLRPRCLLENGEGNDGEVIRRRVAPFFPTPPLTAASLAKSLKSLPAPFKLCTGQHASSLAQALFRTNPNNYKALI
jgi:hypothetical protein